MAEIRSSSPAEAGRRAAIDVNDAYETTKNGNFILAAEVFTERLGQSSRLFANKPNQQKQFAEQLLSNTDHLPEIELSMMTMRHKKVLNGSPVVDLSDVGQEAKTTSNSVVRKAALDTLKNFEGDRSIQIIDGHKVVSRETVLKKMDGLKKNDNLESEYDRLMGAKDSLFRTAGHNKGDLFSYMAGRDSSKTSLTRQELTRYLAKAELFEDWQIERRLGNKEARCPISRKELIFFSADRRRAAEEMDRLWDSPGGAMHGIRTNADGYRTLKRTSLEALSVSSYSGPLDRYEPSYDQKMKGEVAPSAI